MVTGEKLALLRDECAEHHAERARAPLALGRGRAVPFTQHASADAPFYVVWQVLEQKAQPLILHQDGWRRFASATAVWQVT